MQVVISKIKSEIINLTILTFRTLFNQASNSITSPLNFFSPPLARLFLEQEQIAKLFYLFSFF